MATQGDTNQNGLRGTQPESSSTSGSSGASGSTSASGTGESTKKDDKLVTHAKQVATHVSDKAKTLLDSEVQQTQKRSVGELTHVADVLRSAKRELGDSAASPIVDAAAEQVERASRFLENATLSDLANELETLARREPLLFYGGAFAIGMLGARFLKSSARRISSAGDDEPSKTATQSMPRGRIGTEPLP